MSKPNGEMQHSADKIFGGDPDATTVAQAKDWLRLRAGKKGAFCPCCKQYVKIYKRALNGSMAVVLIAIVRAFEKNQGVWTHVPTLINASFNAPVAAAVRGDWAKLEHWGLIEPRHHDGDIDKKHSGYWRPTFKGIDFVKRRCMVPSHVYLYDNMKLKEEEQLIDITDALGKKLSYEELMAAPINIQVPV